MNPLISIIVPIYNIECYLGTCIESIIKQTYTNLEIILVDDGSPDRCSEICDLYAKKDSRIRVIHKSNGGLVSARKAGLAAATGIYVGYVDGDDWIGPGFIEVLYCAIQNADMSVAGQSRDLFNTNSYIINNMPAGRYEGEDLTVLQQNMLSCGDFFKLGITTYVWNKLFKREKLIKHQNAVDNQITIGEDAAVVYPYIMECTAIQIINNCEYHYCQREGSMLKKSNSFQKEALGLKILYSHLMNFAKVYPQKFNLQNQIEDYLLATCIMRSGGILKELQGGEVPYNKDFYGKRIVVWSAGTFGQQLINRINEHDYCSVVGWLDADYWEYRRCCLDVDPINAIKYIPFDYLVIATVNNQAATSVMENFMDLGIPRNKILTVSCPKEKRKMLLCNYLSID